MRCKIRSCCSCINVTVLGRCFISMMLFIQEAIRMEIGNTHESAFMLINVTVTCSQSCQYSQWVDRVGSNSFYNCIALSVCVRACVRACARACVRACVCLCVGGFPSQPRWRRSGQPARHSEWQEKQPRSVGQLTVRLWGGEKHNNNTSRTVHLTFCNATASLEARHRPKLCVRTNLTFTSGVSAKWWTVTLTGCLACWRIYRTAAGC